MTKVCDKCGYDLNIHRGVIQIIYPVFIQNKFKIYYLCRGCFIEGDNFRADEFFKWIEEQEKKVVK